MTDSLTGNINVSFASSNATGLSQRITVAPNTKVEDFLKDQNQSIENVTVRINRENASEGQLLQDGDRITVTIAGIKGS